MLDVRVQSDFASLFAHFGFNTVLGEQGGLYQ